MTEAAMTDELMTLVERLAAETARADANGLSCTELYKVLRTIIRNSPDAYAVKVATEALAMPWLTEQESS
jgi:hypothetical protein